MGGQHIARVEALRGPRGRGRRGSGGLWTGLATALLLLASPRATLANTCTLKACTTGCNFTSPASWTSCGGATPHGGDVVIVPPGSILNYDASGVTTGPWNIDGAVSFDPGTLRRDANGMRTLIVQSALAGNTIDLTATGQLTLRARDRLLFATAPGPAIVSIDDGGLLDAQGTVTQTVVSAITSSPADAATCGTTSGRKWSIVVPGGLSSQSRRQGRLVFMTGRAAPRHYEIVSATGTSPIVVCSDLPDALSANFECSAVARPFACCLGARSGTCTVGQRLTKHTTTGAPPVPAHSVPEIASSSDTRLDPAVGDQIALVSDAWIGQVSGTGGYQIGPTTNAGTGRLPIVRAVNLASPGLPATVFASFNVNATSVTSANIEFNNVHDYVFDDGFVYGGAHDYLIQWNAGHDSATTAPGNGAIFLPRNTVAGIYGSVTSPIDNVSVLHNHLYATNGNAIQVNVGFGTSTGNKIDYNLVHDGCTTLDGECNGIEVGSCRDCEVAYNLVYNVCSLLRAGYSGIDSHADTHHNWVVNICGSGIFPAADNGNEAQEVSVTSNYVSHVEGSGVLGGGLVLGNVIKNWGLSGLGDSAGVYQGIEVEANYLGVDDAVAASPTCSLVTGGGCAWTGVLEDQTIGNWNATPVDIRDNIVSGILGSNQAGPSCVRLQPVQNFSATIEHLTCDGRGSPVVGIDNAIAFDPGWPVSVVALDIAQLYASGTSILVCPDTTNVFDAYGTLYSLQSANSTVEGGTVSGVCDVTGSLTRPVDDMGYVSRANADYNFVPGAAGLTAGGSPPGSPVGARAFRFDRNAIVTPWAGIVSFDGLFPVDVANVPNTDTDGDGVMDLFDDCPGVSNPGQQDVDRDGVGDLCDLCPFDPFDDEDHDGVCGNIDNCPLVPNPDQSDVNANGIGDACDGPCGATVDAAGAGDYTLIQPAVDHLASLGRLDCRVHIRDGTYPEHLTLPAPVILEATGPGVPVVDGGGTGTVVTVPAGSGDTVSLQGITVRGGSKGISTSRSLDLTDVTVTQVAAGGIGLEVLSGTTSLHGGDFEVAAGPASVGIRVASASGPLGPGSLVAGTDSAAGPARTLTVQAPGGTAIDVAAGASGQVRGAEIHGAGTGIHAAGSINVSSSLIVDGTTGIAIDSLTGSQATAAFVTISGNATGITNLNTRTGSLSLSRSILWGNVVDLANLASCSQITGSDVGSADCTAGGNPGSNMRIDPSFVDPLDSDPRQRDYRLKPGSALLDPALASIKPGSFKGSPCRDLGGAPRLRDANGDGLSSSDLGAYESARTTPGPGEVDGPTLQSPGTLVWTADPAAASYSILRGTGRSGNGALGYCVALSPLQTGFAATTFTDPEAPPAGSFFYYLVQAVDAQGRPGTLGDGTCAERSPASLCGP